MSRIRPRAATLVILAGGRSRRMGTPKATLPIAGTTLVGWLIDRLGGGFDEVLVATGDGVQLPAGLQARPVPDLHAGCGPLAGIEAGLAQARHERVVAIACDLPLVPPALVELLLAAMDGHDAAVPLTPRPEPTCAAYRRTGLRQIGAALDAGRYTATEFLADLHVRYLDQTELSRAGVAADSFLNVNTVSDYRGLLARLPV